MGQKLIRNIPDETMRVIETRAAQDGKSAETWMRDLLEEMTAVRSDEGAYDHILLYIRRIDDMLDSIKAQLKPWTEMDSQRVEQEIAHPVQCLMCLLYMQSDMLHSMDLLNRMVGTLKEEGE